MANSTENLYKERKNLQSQLKASTSSSKGLSLQQRQLALDKRIAGIEKTQLQEKWYGTKNKMQPVQETVPKQNLLQRGFSALLAPSKAVVGAAQYVKRSATGESDKGFFDTVNENMGPKGTQWGSFLREMGAPNVVSAPLGFALDIGLDPLAMATMGTSMVVPKIAWGTYKGGLKAGGAALEEFGSRTAYKALKFVPGLRMPKGDAGRVIESVINAGPEEAELAKNVARSLPLGLKARLGVARLGERAISAGERFDQMTGRNIDDILRADAGRGTLGVKGMTGKGIGETLENVVKGTLGEGAVKFLKYSPLEYGERSKQFDRLRSAMKDRGLGLEGGVLREVEYEAAPLPYLPLPAKKAEVVVDAMERAKLYAKEHGEVDPYSIVDDLSKTPGEGRMAVLTADQIAKEGASILQGMDVSPETGEKFIDFLNKIGATSSDVDVLKTFVNAAREMSPNKTGWKAFDDGIEKINQAWKIKLNGKEVSIGHKLLSWNENLNKIFALAKVPLSAPAYVNATIGNAVNLTMAGGSFLDPLWMKSFAGAWKVYRGKSDEAFVQALLNQKGVSERVSATLKEMPTYARQTFGFDIRALPEKMLTKDAMLMAEKEGEPLSLVEVENVMKEIKAMSSKEKKHVESTGKLVETIQKKGKVQWPGTVAEFLQKSGEEGVKASDLPGTWFAQEILGGSFGKTLATIQKKAETSRTYDFIYKAMTKPGSWYSSIDGTYKLSTWHYYVTAGVKERELRVLNRLIPGFAEKGISGVKKANGEVRYLLNPEAALDAVNEVYMNYSAMPGAVQMMRSIPILGSTFASFPYAMTSKLMKTLGQNPASFNAISSLFNEMAGDKTPLEKKALESKYNSYLNQPGYVSFGALPFFQKHPYYLNLTNALPHYTLNMFLPSERGYGEGWKGAVTQIVDSSPFLKNPVGTALVDDLLVPSILAEEGEAPIGYFGQQVWPTKASFGEKVAYSTRNFAESFVPGVAGYAGLAAAAAPSLNNEWVPSYRYRSIANALEGKSSIGVQTKDAPGKKTLQAILGASGISYQDLDLTQQTK